MKNLEEAIMLFSNDNFATKQAGIKIIDVSKNHSKCEMQITANHINAAGFIMGGAIFTLADFAFAVASNFGQTKTATLSSNINFLSTSKCDMLIAETMCLKDGKTICFFETTITDCIGTVVAFVSSTGFRTNNY